jgi:signal transduction histidine kinase
VEFLAVPLINQGAASGVFVVAIFRDRLLGENDAAVAGVAATGGAVLVIGSLLAWQLADRILRPVNKIGQAARSISLSDLTRRIEVEGRDELAHLATTFNEMLERLEKAMRSQKQFFDDVSHELRTPITIVRGHVETAEAGTGDFEKVKPLVMDELNRMSRFVDDLLLLARSERPDFLELDIVDVQPLTDELFGKAEALGPREWILESVGGGRIEADRQRLSQAVLELARNACKHTDTGDVIALGSQVADGECRFWVRDTGKGVEPDDHDRIFSRFGRSANGRSKDGSGLGLAIVKAIAEAHHGRVELTSVPAKGATFRIVFPVDQPVRDQSAEEPK